MPATTSYALLASGIASIANAYTQVNIASPFMHKNVDPIVFPGSYSDSHLHSFYGSDALNASSESSAFLRQGCTNAENINDLSVYWVPTLLYQSGSSWEPVPVSRFSAYYGLGDNGPEIPFPENFQMIAGDALANSEDSMPAEAGIEWFCEGDEDSGLDSNGFPTQTCSTHLQTLLYFPQCVNTDTLEYAYKEGRPGAYYECPSGMQAIPQLRFSIRYDLRDALPNGWSGEAPLKLASGNAWSSHGDFINGWTQEGGEALVQAASDKHDFQDLIGHGEMMSCEQTDAEPDMGVYTDAEATAVQESGASSSSDSVDTEAVETTEETTDAAAPATEENTAETSSGSSSETVAKYHQCGGIGYGGSTTCADGSTCEEFNPYWAMCV